MEELHNINRRSFIKKTAAAALATAWAGTPLAAVAARNEVIRLTILHTNDVHSRIDPFPMDGTRYQGLGGVARRAAIIKQIRATERNVLLLDAGDTVQGTPYFNFFKGQVEMEMMSKLQYDAATVGNHDFDNGPEGLVYMMQYARFPFLVANYDFTDTALRGTTNAWKIFHKQGVKIGVFGIGVQLQGLVNPQLCKGVIYQDPVPIAHQLAYELKNKHKCNMVICLSHLGYDLANQMCDTKLAAATSHIDLIIGGHSHTFMPQPEAVKNKEGQLVYINQVGFAGINLGRIDFELHRTKGKNKIISGTALTVAPKNNGAV